MNKEKRYWIGVMNFPLDLFALATLSIILFLTIELISRIQNLYLTYPDIDVITHLAAGISFTYTFYFIATMLHDKYRKRLSFGFTFIGAIIWEVIETLGELLVVDPPYLRDIFFWDGFFDIFFTMVGSGIALLLLSRLRVYFQKSLVVKFFEKK